MIELHLGWLNEGGHDAMVAIPTRDEIRGCRAIHWESSRADALSFYVTSGHEQKRDTLGHKEIIDAQTFCLRLLFVLRKKQGPRAMLYAFPHCT